MRTEDFDFTLPEKLIAQHPCEPRDHSRMMVVDRRTQTIECTHFFNIPRYMTDEDSLVINNSKVIPARLIGKKATGGTIEILLLARHNADAALQESWEVLLRPAKRVKIGTEFIFNDTSSARVLDRISEKKWLLQFMTPAGFDRFLDHCGGAPLPPYIKRPGADKRNIDDIMRYQTTYAAVPGSIAAPTAGLHFSETVLHDIRMQHADIVTITLHVGYGTFLPITHDVIEEHTMENEYFEVTREAADALNRAKRITAVGTTATRVLESLEHGNGRLQPHTGHTRLYIYPGYRFKRVDRLLTNFHLPRSSLFLLVCAFAGRELMMEAYRKAIEEEFRFYSYGDCMLII